MITIYAISTTITNDFEITNDVRIVTDHNQASTHIQNLFDEELQRFEERYGADIIVERDVDSLSFSIGKTGSFSEDGIMVTTQIENVMTKLGQ